MGILLDEVSFEMIGKGGLETDRTAVQSINEGIQRLAQMVHEDDRDDKASITVKIDVVASDENGVMLSASVKSTEPKRLTKGLAAIVTPDGQILTAQHRQEPLPGITRLNAKGENDVQ